MKDNNRVLYDGIAMESEIINGRIAGEKVYAAGGALFDPHEVVMCEDIANKLNMEGVAV